MSRTSLAIAFWVVMGICGVAAMVENGPVAAICVVIAIPLFIAAARARS